MPSSEILVLRPPAKPIVIPETPADLKIVEDVQLYAGEIRFVLAEFLEKNERGVPGTVMRARAKQMGGLTGESHARLILANRDLIPKSWGEIRYFVLPGTLYKGQDRKLWVPYLCQEPDWRLFFHGGIRDDSFYSSGCRILYTL